MQFFVPATNVCICGTLKGGGTFAGVPVTSLNCYGTNHRIPRLASTESSMETEYVNRCFVRLCCIYSTEPVYGVVKITAPASAGPVATIITDCCLVMARDEITSIVLETAKCDGGAAPDLQFDGWFTDITSLGTNNPITINLSALTDSRILHVRAEWSEGGGT